MSTLKVHLKVAVNLLAGTCVFEEYRKETEEVAQALDHQYNWVKEAPSGTKFGRAFKILERKERRFFSLRGHICVLKTRVRNLYKIGVEEAIELEKWFELLLTDYSYKGEYEIECPWLKPALAKEEVVQATA